MSTVTPTTKSVSPASAAGTAFSVLLAISFCHLLNDMMQAVLPAIYPTLKMSYHLNFAQIGLMTLAFQFTASLLQPAVGFYADTHPLPFSLASAMVFTLAGILLLSIAWSYPVLLAAAALVGVGSSVFHPESSRVARMASGGRFGLAQSLFQVGGNTGSALGPLTAALIVALHGQKGIAWYALVALLAIVVLFNVGRWYKHHGLLRLKAGAKPSHAISQLPQRDVMRALAILVTLIVSKYFYLTSIGSYYTFYLIDKFHLSVHNAQIHLFAFLVAVALGTMIGGPAGDRYGRKFVIWFSILGALPFTLTLPFANLFWTEILSFIIGVVLASAFSAIVVFGQELMPSRVGAIAGLFFGFSFGIGGLGAAALGVLADHTSIAFIYRVCAFLPAFGLLTVFLPNLKDDQHIPAGDVAT